MYKDSFRFLNTKEFIIDAFRLETGDWFLFAYIFASRIEDFTQSHWSDFQNQQIKAFPHGNVVGVGGALKSLKKSVPLPSNYSEEMWAKEDNLLFKIKPNEVLNPGLFLDQKENRKFLRTNFSQLEGKVANLFSYTGAFSCTLAQMGFEVESVDVSKNYQRWELENFKKNNLKVSNQFNLDSREFLKRSKSKYVGFVVDPPSFAKSPKVFQVRKDLPKIIALCFEKLISGGFILATSNLETWKMKDFEIENLNGLPKNSFSLKKLPRTDLNSILLVKK